MAPRSSLDRVPISIEPDHDLNFAAEHDLIQKTGLHLSGSCSKLCRMVRRSDAPCQHRTIPTSQHPNVAPSQYRNRHSAKPHNGRRRERAGLRKRDVTFAMPKFEES
jgi:hypothetical protein